MLYSFPLDKPTIPFKITVIYTPAIVIENLPAELIS
jgi:hypothetical protein